MIRIKAQHYQKDRVWNDLVERGTLIAHQKVTRKRHKSRAKRRISFFSFLKVLLVLSITFSTTIFAWQGYEFIHNSPIFHVNKFIIKKGDININEQEILNRINPEFPMNIFAINPEEIKKKIKTISNVHDAYVVKRLPDVIEIYLKERRPYAIAYARQIYVVDEEGYLIDSIDKSSTYIPDLPIISGLKEEDIQASIHKPHDSLNLGLEILEAVVNSGRNMADKISEINISDSANPVLITHKGIEIILGLNNLKEKLSRLHGVLFELEKKGGNVDYIDMRFKDQVVIKMKNSGV